jgi:hypothetical protein
MLSVTVIARVLALALMLVAGCTTMRREVIVSARHPASPDAPEAPLPPDSTTLSVEPAGASTEAADGMPTRTRPHQSPLAASTPAANPAPGDR